MRTAVVRINVDPHGALSVGEYEAGIEQLRRRGLEVIHTPAEQLPKRNREVELIVENSGSGSQGRVYTDLCADVFGTACVPGVITFVSRGTDEDALGILAGFGLSGEVEREGRGDEELVIVTVAQAEMRRVPESRLHTAMEAALNCEVRILTV